MQAALEPRVRCLVADTLGVGVDELAPDVSLTDELAADSLDLAELAARLEAELGLVVPERVVAYLRTYGDLVRAAIAAAPERAAARACIDIPVPVRIRLVSPHGELLRAELLTPYVAETIVDQALRAGRGARLEITVAEDASDVQLARVHAEFAWLAEQGPAVAIGRAERSESRRPSAAA
jgi:acyl carrier protein